MRRTAEWLADHFKALGFPKVEVSPTAGHPIVYAEYLADVLGVPLEIVETPEAAAVGAALLAGTGAGAWLSAAEAAAATVRILGVREPVPERAERYSEMHAAFRALYPAVKPHFPA